MLWQGSTYVPAIFSLLTNTRVIVPAPETVKENIGKLSVCEMQFREGALYTLYTPLSFSSSSDLEYKFMSLYGSPVMEIT